MRFAKAIVATGLLLFASVVARADIFVATTGNDTTGNGSSGNPYRTIQNAYNRATVQGETIRVRPGTYNETVNCTGGTIVVSGQPQQKYVHLVATSTDNTQTTIDGNGVNTTLTIGGRGGSVTGLTIRDGGVGAVKAVGNVTIQNCRIKDSTSSSDGGGVLYSADTCTYGAVTASFLGNHVFLNHATNDGGGMTLRVAADPAACQNNNTTVVFTGNTIEDNTAVDDGAGLEIDMNVLATRSTTITVTQNTFRHNITSGVQSEGGGMRARILGQGTSNVLIADNLFETNTTTIDGGGFELRVDQSVAMSQTVRVENNIVRNNTAGGEGGGMSLRLESVSVDHTNPFYQYSFVVTGNTVTGNLAHEIGGGIAALHDSFNSNIDGLSLAEFIVADNIVTGNSSLDSAGGISVSSEANVDPEAVDGCDALANLPAISEVQVYGNLIAKNSAPSVGGVLALSLSCRASTTSRILARLNTIADNIASVDDAGGIEYAVQGTLGGTALLDLSNSIVSGNQGPGVQGVNSGTTTFTVRFNDVFGNTGGNWGATPGNQTGSNGNISVNPLYVNPATNNYRLSASSTLIDAGHPAPGLMPAYDFELHPRVVDGDGDGRYVVDMGYDEFFVCSDPEGDAFGFPSSPGDTCPEDNCPDWYSPGQNDCDNDGIGDWCDASGGIDVDEDGSNTPCDTNDNDVFHCGDIDDDDCEDCVTGFSNTWDDGLDSDHDGLCDLGDPDDDDDGTPDGLDSAPLNPFVCRDSDLDTCDDCLTGFTDPDVDGTDTDSDGFCDAGDSNDTNPNICADTDADTCNDCSSGTFNPASDGTDLDADGLCDAGDPDIDGDSVANASDSNPTNRNVCRDLDTDACDDCTSGTANTANDGPDFDADGACNTGDTDDDNDGVADVDDPDDFNPNICGDVDTDTCDDCSVSPGTGPTTLLTAAFAAGAEGFTYLDDTFRATVQPTYASGTWQVAGGFAGGGLQVQVGGVNATPITNMSGGWRASFSLAAPRVVTVTVRYRMNFPGTYEADELSQVLLTVDSTLHGTAPNDWIAQFVGGTGTAQTTNWLQFTKNVGTLSAGSHTITIGGFNSKKTTADEITDFFFDDVLVQAAGVGGGNPANDGVDFDADGRCDAGDVDDDNDGVNDPSDPNDGNPDVCGDADIDTCDDCVVGTDNLGTLPDNLPGNDGVDFDADGKCDAGDPDDDNDGVNDATDPNDGNPDVCGDADTDTCDDCTVGTDNLGTLPDNLPGNDGADFDTDGLCNAGDPDDDNDGVADGSDSNALNPNVCRDLDTDTCDDCTNGTSNVANDGPDFDADGRCNAGDVDDDNDGVLDAPDPNDANPDICGDADTDTCDDCTVGTDNLGTQPDNLPNNDGPDFDADGRCNAGDVDDDNDGVLDAPDPNDANPDICGDADTDTCDDCTVGTDNLGTQPDNLPANDGPDFDTDGLCNAGDPDDDNDGVADGSDSNALNPNVCRDLDTDTCDDCTNGTANVANDGADFDADGSCNAGDTDDDNDGVGDAADPNDGNPDVCGDTDTDTCDDCAVGTDNLGTQPDNLPNNDGPDFDADGRCNAGDVDDDNDGVLDPTDPNDGNPDVCGDADTDTCDDCTVGTDNLGTLPDNLPGNDGPDFDTDGQCNAGDPDDDNDNVSDALDSNDFNPNVCRDSDSDTCDDCTSGTSNTANDGADFDADGSCNAGDADDDNDGVGDTPDPNDANPDVCGDADTDTCDDCTVGTDNLGTQPDNLPANDGVDFDADGRCDAGDVDDDNDGVNDPTDPNDGNPDVCGDADTDTCDDCTVGTDNLGTLPDNLPANDGSDFDTDGLCNAGDPDDDNDGVADGSDSNALNPNVCRDLDTDTCDDCTNGTANVANDGADFDADGACNAGDTDDDNDGVGDATDPNDANPDVCGDTDTDTCDDCAVGTDNLGTQPDNLPNNDGPDFDADGRCNAGDVDDDNDGVGDTPDPNDANPDVCGDADTDTCDDCTVGTDNLGTLPDNLPGNDGADFDTDGLCDAGDPDDDNDLVGDAQDSNDTNPNVCRDADADTCDDCTSGTSNTANDGADFDADGSCNAGDPDDDNDLVNDAQDSNDFNSNVCRDADADTCDDCTSGTDAVANDGPDFEPDGLCDAGDPDDDNDLVSDAQDSNDFNRNVCRDADADTCDDCTSGTDAVANDGPDFDTDGACNAGDGDDDNDGVGDAADPNDGNADVCGDVDTDTCDDCSVGTDNTGTLPDNLPNNDGPDFDTDGRCNAGDVDDDNDGVNDPSDPNDGNADVCGDADFDTCDDCTVGTDNTGALPDNKPNDDGADLDTDGLCDAGDTDDDADGVVDAQDPATSNPDICGDSDADQCDDCAIGTDNLGPAVDRTPGNDGPDLDSDGLCDAGDGDVDGDGVDNPADCAPVKRAVAAIPQSIGATLVLDRQAGTTLRWERSAQGLTTNVYRGAIAPTGAWIYNETCLVSETTELTATDGSLPAVNHAWYYLLGAANVCGESAIGQPTVGTRLSAPACATVSGESDGDGVPDLEDNCPSVPNALLNDVDRDFVGDTCDNCSGASNVDQGDTDDDGSGDVCDSCTDFDHDGFGDPEFTNNTCPDDNCPAALNANQLDQDSDGRGDACDVCHLDANDDIDADSICGNVDNCVTVPNRFQQDFDTDGQGDHCDTCTDTDGDGFGNAGFALNACALDNCPTTSNSSQADPDGDGRGTACDNCPAASNVAQGDADVDGFGDVCDACHNNPNTSCVACTAGADLDGDGVCHVENRVVDFDVPAGMVPIQFGAGMRYLANTEDPHVTMETWVAEGFIDSGWATGTYGVGYETATAQPWANALLQTTVATTSASIYTRARIEIADADAIDELYFGADYDDAISVWINGHEVYRSPGIQSGTLQWNTPASTREPSNGNVPNYGALIDISSGIQFLHDGTNVVAIGVWNAALPQSSDLVLVPRLLITAPTMRYLANSESPGAIGDWTAPSFSDSAWTRGLYGVGYETAQTGGADHLIKTWVPIDTRSVFTRATFDVDPQAVTKMYFRADWDDGIVAWLNGVEIWRSPEVFGSGVPTWANPTNPPREPSNGTQPTYQVEIDASSLIPVLQTTGNVFALGVWNAGSSSSDLVVVPQLALLGNQIDNCPNTPNIPQTDTDGDGRGDACDP